MLSNTAMTMYRGSCWQGKSDLTNTFRLFCEGSFVKFYVGIPTDVNPCTLNEIKFLDINVSMFKNVIPTFTNPITCTFVNNVVLNSNEETPI